MTVQGVGQGNYNYNAPAAKEVKSNDNQDSFMVTEGNSGKTVLLNRDALLSFANAQTGESINVYKDESYSKDNPVYLIKGTDRNGNLYEQKVDIRNINPSNCSFIELAALNIENSGGKMADKDMFRMMIMQNESGAFMDKNINYIAVAEKQMEDQKKMGNWESMLWYQKWISNMGKYCADGILKNGGEEEAIPIGGTAYTQSEWDKLIRSIDKNIEDIKEEQKERIEKEMEKENKNALSFYDELFANTAEGVEDAWNAAKDVTGIDGSGLAADGKATHISQIMKDRILGGEDSLGAILGTTVESAIQYAQHALRELSEELSIGNKPNREALELTEKEKEFYEAFLKNLSAEA